jgi:hypothetical protein
MSVSYTCPNPDCGVILKTPSRVAAGKSVKCPKCGNPFVPEPEGGAPPPAAAAAAAPAARKSPFVDDDEESDESIKRGYGVIKDSEEEVKATKKNRPKFTEVQDKFKKSARGPAQALLVMPSNLLLGAGLIVCAGSIVFFIIGMWPLVFNDAPPGEEELDEAVFGMLMGLLGFVWGGLVCYGASQMQELGSFVWAMLGSIMGVPLLVGVFALIMLQNPKVKAGFEEAEAGPDEDDEDEEGADDDDDDDDDDDSGTAAKKKKRREDDAEKRRKKAVGRLGGMLMGAVLGDEEEDGGDDEDDSYEDEEPDEEEEVDEEETDEAEEPDDEEEDDDGKKRKKKKKRR